MASCLSKCLVGLFAVALLAGCGKIDAGKLVGVWKLDRTENMARTYQGLKFQDNKMSSLSRGSRSFTCGVDYAVDGNKLRWKDGCGMQGQEVEIEDLNDTSLSIKYGTGKMFYTKTTEAEALR